MSRATLEAALRAKRLETTIAPPVEVPAYLTVSTGFDSLDVRLAGGLPRGQITEVAGPTSSGRTTLAQALLASATSRGEVVAVVDATDAFDPASAAAAGVECSRVLWIRAGAVGLPGAAVRTRPGSAPRCDNRQRGTDRGRAPMSEFERRFQRQEFAQLARVFKALDLVLQAGGFGIVMLDVGDVRVAALERIPFTSWYRYQRMIAHTPTALIVVAGASMMGNACAASLALRRVEAAWNGVLQDVAIEVAIRRPRPLAGGPPIRLACRTGGG